MIVAMQKVLIVGERAAYQDVLHYLYQMQVMHLTDLDPQTLPGEYFRRVEKDAAILKLKTDIEQLMINVSGMMVALHMEDTGAQSHWHEDWFGVRLVREAQSILDKVNDTVRPLLEQKERLTQQRAILNNYEALLKKFEQVAVGMDEQKMDVTALLIETREQELIDALVAQVEEICGQHYRLEKVAVDEKNSALFISYLPQKNTLMHELFAKLGVSQVRLPEEFAATKFVESMHAMRTRLNTIPVELEKLEQQLFAAGKKYTRELVHLHDHLRAALEQIEAGNQMVESESFFAAQGFVPTRGFKRFADQLNKKFKGTVYLVKTEPAAEEEIPVALKNSSLSNPFEFVTQMFSLPQYGLIDPTAYVAFFFVLFFGIIVGDVGYAVFILLLALFAKLKLKGPAGDMVGKIFGLGGISALLFGIFYGEVFGDLPHRLHWIGHPIELLPGLEWPFDRLKFMIPLLLASIAIGAFHVLLGLVLGIVNQVRLIRHGHSKKHLYEKVGMMLLLFAAFAGIATFAGALPQPGLFAAGGLFLAGVVFLIMGLGVMGILEIMSLLSNVFSYARLMAVGLAGAVLAFVANELVLKLGNVALGIVVALLLHMLNFIVILFSPTIHSVRLNVVEFFGKFHQGGGVAYQPFGVRRRS